MQQLFDLNGQVAVVTGGNGGIGRAIALAYAEAGSAVAILARNPEKNANVLSELKTIGKPAQAIEVDISDRAQLGPAFERVENELGPVSILVNNAGVGGALGGILTLDPVAWDRLMETNLTAAFLLSQLAARSMVQRRRGKIINIASASVTFGWPRNPAYAISKAAMVHLTKCLAVELGPFNIQANAIAPGWVDTDMVQRIKNGPRYEQTINLTPAGRWATPEDIAGTAVYLASSAADFVSGATIFADGGTTVTYGASLPERTLPDF